MAVKLKKAIFIFLKNKPFDFKFVLRRNIVVPTSVYDTVLDLYDRGRDVSIR